MSSPTKPDGAARRAGERGPPTGNPRRSGINWFRFCMQMLAAMVVFNIVAGLVTWYFIFPHLHPAP
jgi:hypothetical protein